MVQFLAHNNEPTVNPLLSTLGAYLFQKLLNFFKKVDTEGLFEMGGWVGGEQWGVVQARRQVFLRGGDIQRVDRPNDVRGAKKEGD